MIKYLKIAVWVLMLAAVALFWISLRSGSDNLEYTWAALLIWGIAFLTNRYVKKNEEKT